MRLEREEGKDWSTGSGIPSCGHSLLCFISILILNLLKKNK